MNARQIARATVPQVIPTARPRRRYLVLAAVLLLSLASAAMLMSALSTKALADTALTEAEQLAFDAGLQVGREEMAQLAAAAYERGRSDALAQLARVQP